LLLQLEVHRYIGYEPFKGAIPGRNNGSLISMENGKAIPYSIDKLQDRGKFFVNLMMKFERSSGGETLVAMI
jgi:predicted membrane GTPase involved in stress response